MHNNMFVVIIKYIKSGYKELNGLKYVKIKKCKSLFLKIKLYYIYS